MAYGNAKALYKLYKAPEPTQSNSDSSCELLQATADVNVGKVVNLNSVIGQSEDGSVQGLIWALKEQLTFDRETVTSRDSLGYLSWLLTSYLRSTSF
jgi:Molybdopterin-binding domain of aldehyde dehydrogenase